MKKTELVFVPTTGIGHMISTVEFAKCLLEREEMLVITILTMGGPSALDLDSYNQEVAASNSNIRFIAFPPVDPPLSKFLKSLEKYIAIFMESHKSHVKDAIINQVLPNSTTSLAGLVIDMFCSSMVDVANELGIPSYVFFTSVAAFLAIMLHLPIHYSRTGREFNLSDPDSIISGFRNPVPETPPIYTVGPLLNLGGRKEPDSQHENIMKWPDDQPPSSVIFLCFLCFGSLGTFEKPQLAEIAKALQQSGNRFLWSIRRPPLRRDFTFMPSEYTNFSEALPVGFIEQTQNRGLVCGWASQVDVLAHEGVGAFVSHCGWNSILESVRYGVPILTWPIYAEQQSNAFQLVKELGCAVELTLDYRHENSEKHVIMADEIEKAIKCLMDTQNPVRKKAKEMGEISRKVMKNGGSSFTSVGCPIEDILVYKR